MKHTIVYKNKNEYASFPLLKKLDDRILIGFFTAPVPDHMGVFEWKTLQSNNDGDNWYPGYTDHLNLKKMSPYWLPTASPREISDRFEYKLEGNTVVAGSYGFKIQKEHKGYKNKITIDKSKGLFVQSFDHNWETIDQRFYRIPTADIVLTFPRPLVPNRTFNSRQEAWIRLIPAYIILKNGTNRALAWRSEDSGETWRLYNMFPSEVNVNEMAFIWTDNGILAHLRSDKSPHIMESWSKDGITWTYPTNIFTDRESNKNIIGGPPHLLRLNDNRILCTYGYRQLDGMGIRAIISEDEGNTWDKPIILREDGGFCSSLRKRKWYWQKKIHPGNDTGYPYSMKLDNEEILTAYYITNSDKTTHIAITKWNITK